MNSDNVLFLVDFFSRLEGLPDFLMSFAMMLLFVHGVRAGQHFWGRHAG
jgi:G:T-mismatch repair DNA endonuclease (very short patch repair protein)